MNKRSGFTLIELMIVVIIMAALKLYKLDNGVYPSSSSGGLNALMTASSAKNWKGPYLEDDPNDPWGRPYEYKYPGSHNSSSFDLSSKGADESNSDDDVNNWD